MANQRDERAIQECPDLKVAIGHFGMVTTPSFESQVELAREGKNVKVSRWAWPSLAILTRTAASVLHAVTAK